MDYIFGTSGYSLTRYPVEKAADLLGAGGTLILHPTQAAQLMADCRVLDLPISEIIVRRVGIINGGADYAGMYKVGDVTGYIVSTTAERRPDTRFDRQPDPNRDPAG